MVVGLPGLVFDDVWIFFPQKIGDGGLKWTVAYFCQMDWVKRQLVLIDTLGKQTANAPEN